MTARRFDLATLRAYVRGELTKDERRGVVRQLGRCVDPRLPDLIANLIAEWENEKADERTGGVLARLNERFKLLLGEGCAAIDRHSVAPRLAGATLAPIARAQTRLDLTAEALVTFTVNLGPAIRSALLVASTDSGDVHLLWRQNFTEPRVSVVPQVRYQPEPEEGRVTFWLAVSTLSPLTPPHPTAAALADWLQLVTQDDRVVVIAERISGANSELWET